MSRRTDLAGTKNVDYDKVAEVYDQVRTGDPEMIRQLLNAVCLSRDSLVLDVGCGTANNTLLFAEATNVQVVGIDLSGQMLRKAQQKAPELGFVKSSASLLPFCNNTFDFVFMTDVVHHLSNLDATLIETYRVLNQGCSICIITQSHAQIETRMTSKFFPDTMAVDKARYPDIMEIEKALLGLGYSSIRTEAHTIAPFALSPEYLRIVEMKAYSTLHKISERRFQDGLQAVRDALNGGDELAYLTEYTFIWAIKNAA